MATLGLAGLITHRPPNELQPPTANVRGGKARPRATPGIADARASRNRRRRGGWPLLAGRRRLLLSGCPPQRRCRRPSRDAAHQAEWAGR